MRNTYDLLVRLTDPDRDVLRTYAAEARAAGDGLDRFNRPAPRNPDP